MVYCQKCGTKNGSNTHFCKECGASLSKNSKNEPKKNVTLATVLPLLIGVFAYLYFPNYKKFFIYLIIAIIAVLILGWLGILLIPWYMYDCYMEAKKINGEETS